jgi:flagellin
VIITNNTGARIVFANTTSGIASGVVMAVSGGIAANSLVASGSLNSSAALVQGSGFVEGVVTYDSSRNFATSASVANSWAATSSGIAAGVNNVGSLQSVSTVDITTVSGSFRALAIADAAAEVVNRQRASFGALQSRFDNTVSNLAASVENLSAAKSRILDADFAAETANLTRAQVLQQAGIAVLAQANAIPNNVLALLR